MNLISEVKHFMREKNPSQNTLSIVTNLMV